MFIATVSYDDAHSEMLKLQWITCYTDDRLAGTIADDKATATWSLSTAVPRKYNMVSVLKFADMIRSHD
jgi:hypothetical protein